MVNIPIKGFDLASIEARKFVKPGEKIANVRIDHNNTVTMIAKTADVEVTVDFRFSVSYVGVAVMHMEGKLVYVCKADQIVKLWGETHNMPNEMASEVHTFVLSACIPNAVLIARDLNIPPPIPLPKVEMGAKPAPPPRGVEVA